jgi:HEPN domain-containing protein
MERSADWMRQAQVDLTHAKHDLEAGFYEWTCFSAQQAAEKAAKAVLQRIGAEAWGHSVYDLLGALATKVQVPTELRDSAQELDKAYIPARYPNAHSTGAPADLYNRTEGERLVSHAERILRFCEGLLASL